MKKIFSTASLALLLLYPKLAFAADTPCTKPGVLIRCTDGITTIQQYIKALLEDNMGYVMVIAIVLIVFSGIQYMVAMGVPGEQAKAQQRIFGILGGIIFYFMIAYIAKIIADGII